MKKRTFLILLVWIALPSSLYSSSNSPDDNIKELTKTAEKTNSIADWNKVSEYYEQRIYEVSSNSNYLNLYTEANEKALKAFKTSNKNRLESGKACMHRGEIASFIYGWKEYIEKNNDALILFVDAKSIPHQIRAISNLGNAYLALNMPKVAHQHFHNALKLDKHTTEKLVKKSVLHMNLARSCMELNLVDSASYYLNMAEREATKGLIINDFDHAAETQYYKGLLYLKKKDYISAMNFFEIASKISEETGKNKMLRANIFNQISLLNASWKQYEIALKYNTRAIGICEDTYLTIRLEYVLNNYVALLNKIHEQEDAKGNVKKGRDSSMPEEGAEILSKFRDLIKDNAYALYNNYIQTAMLFESHAVLDSCSFYLNKAYSLVNKDVDYITHIGAYIKCEGNLQMRRSNYKKAISLYETYLKKHINDRRIFLLEAENYEVYANLATCYEKEGDIPKALHYRKLAFQEREKAINDEKEHVLASYFVKEMTFNKEAENVSLKEEMQRYLYAFLIVSLSVAIWLLIRRARIKRTQTENYLRGMEIEKDRMSKELHDNVVSELFAIAKFDATEGEPITNLLIDRLNGLGLYVRDISHKLSLPKYDHSTYHAILDDFLNQQSNEETTFHLITNDLDDLNRLPQNYRFEIYRIIQEATSNTLKYAHATDVYIQFNFKKRFIFTTRKRSLTLTIKDNGCGFDHRLITFGLGLKNMQERTEVLNGKIRMTSQVGSGSKITIRFSSLSLSSSSRHKAQSHSAQA